MKQLKAILKKNVLQLLLCSGFLSSYESTGQENAHRQLEIAAGGIFFLYDEPGWGISGSTKILLPIYKNDNYITIGITYDKLTEKSYGSKYNYTLINLTGSYRKMINKFFIGPQLGAGIYGEEGFEYTGFNSFLGFETGLYKNNLTFSFDYRFNAADGFVFGEQFHLFTIKAGLRF